MKPTFEERLLRWKNNLKLRRLRKKCYDAIDKMREANAQLEAANREIKEMVQ